jgi:hypothetical protein
MPVKEARSEDTPYGRYITSAYADRPGEYLPVRLPWPLDSDTRP